MFVIVVFFLHVIHDVTDFAEILGAFLDLILNVRGYVVDIIRNHIFDIICDRRHAAKRRISDVLSSIHNGIDCLFCNAGNGIKKTSLS